MKVKWLKSLSFKPDLRNFILFWFGNKDKMYTFKSISEKLFLLEFKKYSEVVCEYHSSKGLRIAKAYVKQRPMYSKGLRIAKAYV